MISLPGDRSIYLYMKATDMRNYVKLPVMP
jgi:hypothetical protein